MGADANHVDENGQRPLDLAITLGHDTIARLLIDCGATTENPATRDYVENLLKG